MPKQILLIEDNPDDRYLMKRELLKIHPDMMILQAADADEGLKIIESEKSLNVVFLDYLLPDCDGIKFLQNIYNPQTGLCPCPIVMITGQGSEEIAIDAIKFGAQDYIIKESISSSTLQISMAKAGEVFDLKQKHHSAMERLQHSQKMDAVGKLTGGIAHDFNNLLTIIMLNNAVIKKHCENNDLSKEKIERKVDLIERASKRGSDLVKHLMVFAHQRALEPEVTCPNSLVSEIKTLLRRTIGEFVKIEIELEDDISNIFVDPTQLEHAIINMGVNARDVMPDGGTLRITTKNVTLDEDTAATLKLKPKKYVKINISDTGQGIASDVIDKIFNPFFTTKGVGKGTGLGLSMVYDFVQGTDGTITVQSTPGKGSKFSLYFPVTLKTKGHVDNKAATDNPKPMQGNKEKILLVEDEAEIRELTKLILENADYDVTTANNAAHALEVLENKTDFDILLTDISMPGEMNGVQLAARVEVLIPSIKMIFSSGNVESSIPDMALAHRYTVLNKPYQPEDILNVITSVLEREK